MNRHTMSRRALLGLGAGAVGAAALAGCAPPGGAPINAEPTIPASGGKVTLTYWAWLKDLQKVCDVWNAKNPNVQVEAVWIPGGNSGGYQKLFAALAAGGGPDIGQVEIRSVPEFLMVNGLVDLSRYGAEQYASRYDTAIWNQVKFNNGIYAIPQDSGPMAFYYRTDAFDDIGAEPPKTWDEWAEIAAKLRKDKPTAYLDCFNPGDASSFVAFATQAGATWFKPQGDQWVVNMVDDATLRVARFFDDAIDRDLVNTGFGAYSPGWTAAVGAGQIASVTSASWGDALIESAGGGAGKWRVADMQRWGDGGYGSTYLGGSTSSVMANSRHPKEALDFCVWMTTTSEGINAMIENSGIGWSTARDDIGSSREGPSEFFSGQSYNTEVFAPMAKQQNPDWVWGPITERMMNILADGFRTKLTDGQTLVDSVHRAQQQVVKVMTDAGLSVQAAG